MCECGAKISYEILRFVPSISSRLRRLDQRLCLLDNYGHREEPWEGVDMDWLFSHVQFIRSRIHQICHKVCNCQRMTFRVDVMKTQVDELWKIVETLMSCKKGELSTEGFPTATWGKMWPEQNIGPRRSISGRKSGTAVLYCNTVALHSRIRVLYKVFQFVGVLLHCSEELVSMIGGSEDETTSAMESKPVTKVFLLHFAAFLNQQQLVRHMLTSGWKVEEQWKHGWTLLHVAAFVNGSEAVDTMLETDVFRDLNVKDEHRDTPLHVAVMAGNARIVSRLVECGANVKLPDRYGYKPSFLAVMLGFKDIAMILNTMLVPEIHITGDNWINTQILDRVAAYEDYKLKELRSQFSESVSLANSNKKEHGPVEPSAPPEDET